MKYELDVLAALTRLPEPTTQAIVSSTGISERKVQNVIKTLQTELKIVIKKVRNGRSIHYVITDWGVFESAAQLKHTLADRTLINDTNPDAQVDKPAYYDSVKMSNYKESSRLEGIPIHITASAGGKKSISQAKRALINKYSNYKNLSNSNG